VPSRKVTVPALTAAPDADTLAAYVTVWPAATVVGPLRLVVVATWSAFCITPGEFVARGANVNHVVPESISRDSSHSSRSDDGRRPHRPSRLFSRCHADCAYHDLNGSWSFSESLRLKMKLPNGSEEIEKRSTVI